MLRTTRDHHLVATKTYLFSHMPFNKNNYDGWTARKK